MIFGSPLRAMVKRKYPPMKSGKKVSEKLLSVLLVHLPELHLYFVDLFATLFLWNLRTDMSVRFGDHRAKVNILG